MVDPSCVAAAQEATSQEDDSQLTEIENIYLETSFDAESRTKSRESRDENSGTSGTASGATSCLDSVQRKLFSLLVEDSKCLASVSEPDVSYCRNHRF